MKQSLRARRMDRHHKRSKSQGRLSLVSLMDIFTILVFFLLVNSSEVEVLQTHKSIDLPKSLADQKPESTLVVMINSESILVNGRKVVNTEEVMRSDADEIAPLKEELDYRASRRPFTNEDQRAKGRDATIMGDRGIPYSLLKKVMATLAATDYRNIALAVSRVADEDAVQVNTSAAAEG